MKQLMFNNSIKLGFILLGGFLLTGCTDSNFDLSNIDGTVGIGGDSLSLPGNNSTTSLILKDILELKDSDFIKVDKDGYYMFDKTADDVNTSNASVDQVSANPKKITGIDIVLPFGSSSSKKNARRKIGIDDFFPYSYEDNLSAFEYSFTDIPKEIKGLSSATVATTLHANITFSGLSSYFKTINGVTLSLPKFLKVTKVMNGNNTATPDANNQVTFSKVSTSGTQTFAIYVSGLDFNATETDTNNKLTFVEGTSIYVNGYVKIKITLDKSDIAGSSVPTSSITLGVTADMGKLNITGATGKFSPSFNFDNLGSVTLNSIPEFLSDKDVCIDLYNPQINLNVNSTMPINGKITGTLISKNANGKQIASVSIPDITVPKNANSVISIRKQNTTVGADTVVVVVPNLSDIIKTIPHTIAFADVTVKGDATSTETIDLGKDYTITSKYSMSTPLTFDSDAKIVYRDSVNDWNKNIKDMEFKEENGTINGSIVVTADAINQLPVYLTFSAYAIDNNNDSISTDKISVVVDGTIAATANATNPTLSKIKVTIKPKSNSVFKTLDGLQFRAVGAASDGTNPIVGKRLNERTQSLILKNIKITKVGQIIYKDSDSK